MLTALIATVGVVAYAGPTTRMNILLDGKTIGTAWVTEKPTPTGGKKGQTKLLITNAGARSVFIDETEYDSDGFPVRKYVKRTSPGVEETRSATFGDDVAYVVTEDNGEINKQTVPAPKGVELRAKSEFWFFKVRPRVGERNTYFRFDMDKLLWVETKVKYEGIRVVKLNGVETKANCITLAGLAKTWLTDDGKPIRVEAGKLTLVKSD